MKITFMTTETKISPVHWRVNVPAKFLAQNGHEVRIQNEFDPTTVPDGSIVVTLRTTGRPEIIDEFISILHSKDCIILCDLDDDILGDAVLEHMSNMGIPSWGYEAARREQEDQFLRRYFLSKVDGILVSTPHLKEVVAGYVSTPCFVVPNFIDQKHFESTMGARPYPFDNEVSIGWAGCGRPDRDLVVMGEAWARIAQEYDNVNFVVGGWRPHAVFDVVPNDRIIYFPWTTIDEYAKSMRVDIGCCPLYPSDFNRSKSCIKIFEYALAGAAIVASPTVYGTMVQNWKNGFLASTVDEWVYYLSLLIEHPIACRGVSTEMRNEVILKHSMEYTNGYMCWINAFMDVKGLRNEAKIEAISV